MQRGIFSVNLLAYPIFGKPVCMYQHRPDLFFKLEIELERSILQQYSQQSLLINQGGQLNTGNYSADSEPEKYATAGEDQNP